MHLAFQFGEAHEPAQSWTGNSASHEAEST